MRWECTECGAVHTRMYRPIVCSECGTAGTVSVEADEQESNGFDAGSFRAAWLEAGMAAAQQAA